MTHTETHVERVREGGGGGAAMAFIIGGLLVVVALIAWFVFAGGQVPAAPSGTNLDVDIDAPAAPSLPEVNLQAPEVNLPAIEPAG